MFGLIGTLFLSQSSIISSHRISLADCPVNAKYKPETLLFSVFVFMIFLAAACVFPERLEQFQH